MKKSQKQLLSVLFHLGILACMVVVYDAGNMLIGKIKAAVANKEKTEDEQNGEGNSKSPAGGTTMEDLMRQKAEREAEKKAGMGKGKAEAANKGNPGDNPQGKGNASTPTGGTTMEDLIRQKAQREMEKKANSQRQE